jgi:phosphatidate cytidylyltransferase
MNIQSSDLMKNMLKRTLTAFFMLAVVVVCIQFLSPLGFFIFIQLIVLASLLEFYNLALRREMFPRKVLGVVIALVIALPFYLDDFLLIQALLICLLVSGAYFVFSIRTLEKMVRFSAEIALTFFGPVYLSLTLNFFVLIREEWGSFYVYFIVSVIIIGDTGSFLIGKIFGRHKAMPLASPNKTWEGCLGGLVFAGLGGIAAQQIFLAADAMMWKAVIFALLINIASQLGDPFESLFKRAAGVKDSSRIFPGHGGFLDRADSLVFAAPLFYYLLMYIGLK